jgi:hypothetical protein
MLILWEECVIQITTAMTSESFLSYQSQTKRNLDHFQLEKENADKQFYQFTLS